MRRFFFLCAAVLFSLFAFFQLNDSESSWAWFGLYLFLAFLHALTAFANPRPWLLICLAIICLVTSVQVIPGALEFFTNQDGIGLTQGMSNEYKYIEEMRETGGLVLAIVSLLLIWGTVKKSKPV